jgi:hypothetical protein
MEFDPARRRFIEDIGLVTTAGKGMTNGSSAESAIPAVLLTGEMMDFRGVTLSIDEGRMNPRQGLRVSSAKETPNGESDLASGNGDRSLSE